MNIIQLSNPESCDNLDTMGLSLYQMVSNRLDETKRSQVFDLVKKIRGITGSISIEYLRFLLLCEMGYSGSTAKTSNRSQWGMTKTKPFVRKIKRIIRDNSSEVKIESKIDFVKDASIIKGGLVRTLRKRFTHFINF